MACGSEKFSETACRLKLAWYFFLAARPCKTGEVTHKANYQGYRRARQGQSTSGEYELTAMSRWQER